jgi:hypothetical protein
VFNSVADIDLADWQRVCSTGGASIFLDPRFMSAVEASMKPSCRFWFLIVYDDGGEPVACAGLSEVTVDITDFADPRFAWIIKCMPGLSRFRRLKLLFCSLPGAPGENNLVISATAANGQVLASIDHEMCRLAAETTADAIIYREFAPDRLEQLHPLLELGYSRIAVPPMHLLAPAFESFAQYCAALRKHYRKLINQSVRKMAGGGIVPSVLTDADEILRLYSPDVHDLYRQLVARSDLKLEIFPIEFFQQLTKQLGGQVELIALVQGSRILAFAWCLQDRSTYHMMYGGYDYQANRQYDLYFNLFFACFDRAFRKQVATINVGQTATEFKARMGCYSEPRYVFAKGLGPLMSSVVRYGARWLIKQKPLKPPSNIFRLEDAHNATANNAQTAAERS